MAAEATKKGNASKLVRKIVFLLKPSLSFTYQLNTPLQTTVRKTENQQLLLETMMRLLPRKAKISKILKPRRMILRETS